MSYLVVDASIWVSRLVPQDVFHTTVKAWLEEQHIAGQGFLSPSLLLPEVGGAVSRRTGDPQLGQKAVDALQNLPLLRLIEMDAPLIREAARLAASLGLRGADSTYVAVAAQLGLPMATLDEDQLERAAKIVSTVTISSQKE